MIMCLKGQRLNLGYPGRVFSSKSTRTKLHIHSLHPRFLGTVHHPVPYPVIQIRQSRAAGSEQTHCFTKSATTCRFFGLLRETLYRNTVVVDMLGYNAWCALFIRERGVPTCTLKSYIVTTYFEHSSAISMLTSNNHPAVFSD